MSIRSDACRAAIAIMPEQFQHLTGEALPSHVKDGLYCLMHHVCRDRGQEVPYGTDVSIGYLKSRPSVCWVNMIEHCNALRMVSADVALALLTLLSSGLFDRSNLRLHRSVPNVLVLTLASRVIQPSVFWLTAL